MKPKNYFSESLIVKLFLRNAGEMGVFCCKNTGWSWTQDRHLMGM